MKQFQNLYNTVFQVLLVLSLINAYGIVRKEEDDSFEEILSLALRTQGDPDGQFSYVVSVQNWIYDKNETTIYKQCAGSALNKKWVLTAAHCINKKVTHVEYGQDDKNTSKILKRIPHPAYSTDHVFGSFFSVQKNNIALLKVEEMDIKKAGKLSGLDFVSLKGRFVLYVGFGGARTTKVGKNDTKSLRAFEDLRIGEGGIIQCERSRYTKFEPAICVAPRCANPKQKTTRGDSGGPLVYKRKIIGVNIGNSPIMSDIFTPVSPYFDWISQQLSK